MPGAVQRDGIVRVLGCRQDRVGAAMHPSSPLCKDIPEGGIARTRKSLATVLPARRASGPTEVGVRPNRESAVLPTNHVHRRVRVDVRHPGITVGVAVDAPEVRQGIALGLLRRAQRDPALWAPLPAQVVASVLCEELVVVAAPDAHLGLPAVPTFAGLWP